MAKHLVKERFKKDLKAFGLHLRSLREAQKISQEQLAIYSGISYNSIHEIEAGKLNPTLATLLAICEGLDIELKKLVDY